MQDLGIAIKPEAIRPKPMLQHFFMHPISSEQDLPRKPVSPASHLLKSGRKTKPDDIIRLDHALWQGDVETFLKGLPTYGRSRVIYFAGRELAQVFVEAGLAHGIEDEVVAFWDAMAALARGQKNGRLSEIGRQGERLSIAHEQARTGHKPKWVAIDNNEDGYDVLSIVETGDMRPLSIEVKASTMGLSGLLHLTRNEWERSQEVENHTFHLWAMKSKNQNALAVLVPTELQNHIPTDSGSGSWETVEIPFSVFQSHFVAQTISSLT